MGIAWRWMMLLPLPYLSPCLSPPSRTSGPSWQLRRINMVTQLSLQPVKCTGITRYVIYFGNFVTWTLYAKSFNLLLYLFSLWTLMLSPSGRVPCAVVNRTLTVVNFHLLLLLVSNTTVVYTPLCLFVGIQK